MRRRMRPLPALAGPSLLLIALASGHASVIADRILILPPLVEPGFSLDTEPLWRSIFRAYDEGMVGVETVPLDDVIAAMEGDTLAYDLQALGEAMEWGKRFDADYVVMAETGGAQVQVQRFDPWTAELAGPVAADNIFDAIRAVEPARWVYGRGLRTDPGGYQAPRLDDADRKLTVWLLDHNEYPPDALIELKNSTASVQVTISPQGVPLDIRIFAVEPSGFEFEQAIAKALWSMRYEPARLGDHLVHGMWSSSVTVSPAK